ncbi:metal transporter [Polaribacter reichenbachii]|uniref:Metal transporter n=1 Tax=Polaribacter reichenbachii TaxID=996801 RepID=A0A1B8TW08_9FLAO|nr:heavy-metal-associated domain-containing protein [Polaribacter reichenbachii]APZ45210.1 metal transporter [Polaribacter reichenbachii]AUC19073.1 metal transporter [Polaribacter reichenbachii]OBY63772.1 metal transporter [Polaribacter reichenbachii]
MKKIILVFSLFLIGFSVQSQEVIKNKNAKISFKVDGICGMCKKRIETAALKTKGVKFAVWSVETHQLNLIMDERKSDVAAVQKNILAVGHDVLLEEDKKLEATTEAYNSVHPCCKYREDEIVKEHSGELKKQKKKN